MRKALVLLLAVCLLLSGCAQVEKSEDKLSVCATLFPQYDFARVIAGDKIELRLLLPAGLECPKKLFGLEVANVTTD
jgi:zinc transport system substrate-binding protein